MSFSAMLTPYRVSLLALLDTTRAVTYTKAVDATQDSHASAVTHESHSLGVELECISNHTGA